MRCNTTNQTVTPLKAEMDAFRLTRAKRQDLAFERFLNLPISPTDTFVLLGVGGGGWG